MSESNGCIYKKSLWYTGSDGKNKELKSGVRLTIVQHYGNGKSVLRWGNKMFLAHTDLIIEDEQSIGSNGHIEPPHS